MRIVFLVHGMGTHEDGWAAEAISVLKDSYRNYTGLRRLPFERRFEIVPLEYNSVFVKIVKAWKENASSIGSHSPGVGPDSLAAILNWLGDADVEQEFVWTHAADVILYRVFADVRKAVNTHLANQIIPKINSLKSNDSWSIIGHSLGTAVAHDTLQMIWSGTLEGSEETGFEPRHNQAQLVAMVANVSRILQIDPVYNSLVRPGATASESAGCLNYLNFRHELDPFTIPKMFNPKNWPTSELSNSDVYKHIEVDHYHEKNIHDFAHYLKNPKVHIPIFRRLIGYDPMISAHDENIANENFKRFDFISESQSIELRQRLEEISPGVSALWPSLIGLWDNFNELVG